MKILHTADWHIGQLFHEYDRNAEHRQFLDWLVLTIQAEQVDVLLVSGDVFDISNPSAASVKLFYTFLNRAAGARQGLQIVITAGNHDSASRLEAPIPLLESSDIHIIGTIEKNGEGKINYEKLVIPLYDPSGNIKTWCLAIPFLRMGDYPVIPDCENPYAAGVAALYQEAFDYAEQKKQQGQTIIAMGHLHTHHAEVTDLDKTERLIMGGVECIPAAAFHPDIRYVALGHIHKAQRIGGEEHIRYSGSPLPMSFSELNYKHQVIVFELDQEINHLKSIEIPLFVPLQRISPAPLPLHEILALLEQLPSARDNPEVAPYLEVKVLVDGPEPALRHKIETALAGKHVKLTTIHQIYPASSKEAPELITQEQLNELQPPDIFEKAYQSRYNSSVPDGLMELFRQVTREISNNDAE